MIAAVTLRLLYLSADARADPADVPCGLIQGHQAARVAARDSSAPPHPPETAPELGRSGGIRHAHPAPADQALRKAILRASGLKARHDEQEIYRRETAAAHAAATVRRGMVADWYAFTLSVKGVVLEGLEVVFIALTFGANQHNVPLAALTAAVAVTAAGIAVRAHWHGSRRTR